MKTEAEIGVTWPQAKDRWHPPEARRARKGCSLEPTAEGSSAEDTLMLDV